MSFELTWEIIQGHLYYLSFPSSSASKESTCNGRRPQVQCLGQKIPWTRDRLTTPVFLGFPGGLPGKESVYNSGDLGSIPRLERSPGGGHENPLQDSCMENPQGQRWLSMGSQRVRYN